MLKILALVFLFFTALPLTAQANNPLPIDEYVSDALKVGEGRLVVYFFDVYDAELFAPEGLMTEAYDPPFALRLSYLRSIKGRQISERSQEEMEDTGRYTPQQTARWAEEMNRIFPDVQKGDVLTGIYTAEGETLFYFNDTAQIGRIKDPLFGKAFFDIWLDENTTAPTLRRKLLGVIRER